MNVMACSAGEVHGNFTRIMRIMRCSRQAHTSHVQSILHVHASAHGGRQHEQIYVLVPTDAATLHPPIFASLSCDEKWRYSRVPAPRPRYGCGMNLMYKHACPLYQIGWAAKSRDGVWERSFDTLCDLWNQAGHLHMERCSQKMGTEREQQKLPTCLPSLLSVRAHFFLSSSGSSQVRVTW